MDSDAMEALYGKMREDALLENVRRMASLLGWRAYHTHDSRRSDPGFPDLVLVRAWPGRVMFRELKTQKGRVTVEQQAWLHDLVRAGADAAVWRPFDWASGKIEEDLNK